MPFLDCDGLLVLERLSGYLIGSQQSGTIPLPPLAEYAWWYQYYFATERGRDGYDKHRRDFAKLIWQLASPKWSFDDETFDRSAGAFDNPDHVNIVIHNYRWRLNLAAGEAKYDDLERQLAERYLSLLLHRLAIQTFPRMIRTPARSLGC